ncbi:heavy metal translocating P-type ATPase [Egibacter rhizosphaerae]|uniref:heavy metal translocating P-type ATPase n=1 Tax=Egibacter rhizosphaerae TaxID=1670831 RepID=UPI0013F17CDA|nr:cation-translocating P-type ATPase [Egibacter rhizosphaerae]
MSWWIMGGVAGIVVAAAVGERLGWFDAALERLPWWLLAAALLVGGWPVFAGVVAAARRRRVTAHTLMSIGVLAAAVIGEWTAALLIVFFMRLADWIEQRTGERSRQAVRELAELAPVVARVLRDGHEIELPVERVAAGDLVVVRPGERIPVDGEVVEGTAPVDEASITGESVPVDKAGGDRVFAATIAQAGHLVVATTRVGEDTTFGRILHLVGEAEARKAPIQRFADRFAGYYIPVVAALALLTLLVTGEVLNAVAVVVVACACAIVIATPVAVLASVGSAARRGLVIKGGDTLERLATVDALVVDKTGTLTTGKPVVTDVVPVGDGLDPDQLLSAVAAVEQRSEHPLARAVVEAATAAGHHPRSGHDFTAHPGRGVAASLNGRRWLVGTRVLLTEADVRIPAGVEHVAGSFEAEGKTVFLAAAADTVVGVLALADTVRDAVATALDELRRLGLDRQVMLTGDNERVAATIAESLGIDHRADLLPDDKIAAIEQLQAEGHVVLMVGDGINDAPALAQADVGAAMGVAGTDAALDAADLALMREDWDLVPDALLVGRRSARTIRQNLYFTAGYNLIGVALAAVGILPPVWAAAAQSLPDGVVLANSSRLLRAPDRTKRPSSPRLPQPAREGVARVGRGA